MALSDKEIRTLFDAGRYSDALRLSGFNRRTAGHFESHTRILLAQALTWCGDYRLAAELATGELSHTSASVRASAEVVLGFVAGSSGDVRGAAQHHQAAVRLARESGDPDLLAWSLLYSFRAAIDGYGPNEALSQLAAVRRAVTAAGNPQAAAYLHMTVGMLEGQTGRLDEAKRHYVIARSLLQLMPNARMSGVIHLQEGCVALLRCEFRDAEQQFRHATGILAESGHARGEAGIQNNLAQLAMITGDWERALETYSRVLKQEGGWTTWRLSALEGLARTHLASGDLGKCEAVLNDMEVRVAEHPSLAAAYPVRWATVTRARLLLKRGDSDGALCLLGHAIANVQHTQDTPLAGVLSLCQAVARRMAGDLNGAALASCAADRYRIGQLPDVLSQHYYACSQISAGTDSTLSATLRARAAAVWKHRQIASVEREMHISGLFQAANGEEHDGVTTSGLLNSAGSLVELGHFPELLGNELKELITNLNLTAKVTISDRKGGGREKERNLILPLADGTRSPQKFLICDIPTDPSKAILLADVLRIGRAAVELERYRQDERNRAALWPADPIETEAGALFLAEEMQSLLTTARRIATSNIPVLITGETGTGKEVLARLIHAYSTRAKAPFLPFNCSATPKEMLDAQLFGHRRGAFTGATDNFPGVIRAAAGGTLLLDEIGETTLDVQPKLLRFLESGEVHPIGEAQPLKVDVRIIAATNADLDTLVSEGRFRDDLFYRLNIVRLHLPPLRERRVEIPALADHYLRKYAKENGKGDLRLAEETMEYLVLYRWPGNVRQLANEMRRMAALAESGAVLMPEHLSADIFSSRKTIPASERTLEPTELVVRVDQPMAAAVQHVERSMIIYAMKKCGGGMEETAALLGLSRKGLYLKRQRYAIESPGEGAAAVA